MSPTRKRHPIKPQQQPKPSIQSNGPTLKCILGFHRWSGWKYFYFDIHGCRMERTCDDCDKREVQSPEGHSWQKWAFVEENSCVKERICIRCHAKETQNEWQLEHDWEVISTIHEKNKLKEERECRRCHTRNTLISCAHHWEYRYVDVIHHHVKCTLCGESFLAEHIMIDQGTENPDSCAVCWKYAKY
jgi:hypothetical protein